MKNFIAALLSLTFALCAFAQTPDNSQPGTPSAVQNQLADQISGMYSFLQDGEFVQVTVEDGTRVTGFISRYGELPSDKGAFLDQFIKKGSLEGNKLTFSSDPVHGVWYEFRGTVERGEANTQGQEGYWVLKGTLTRHVSDANQKETVSSREVAFKSFPQDTMVDRPNRD
jgi:hypothetical protein